MKERIFSHMLVSVNPKILIWAREERFGEMPLKEVADKISIDLSDLSRWEADGKDLPFNILEKVAHGYKRQTAAFFLPQVPPKTKKIKDYRNVSVGRKGFSPDTLMAIRRAERYLETTRELMSVDYWDKQYRWTKQFSGDQKLVVKEAELLRGILEAPLDGQVKLRNSEKALRYWRTQIENKLGIFVFQFPMLDQELDGFSYAFDAFPFAIVLNNRGAYARRIFTLFHEMAHIIKHAAGACKSDYLSEAEYGIELDCNKFAAEFLVPGKSLYKTVSVDKVIEYAKRFCVSGEVYLRKLYEENKISKKVFYDWLDEIRKRSKNLPKRKGKGAPSMIIQSKSTRGNKFFDLVTNAAISNQISYSTASDLLGLKVASIGK
jgi:Zn-dependent peptidase ImmA (M78 family)